MHKACTSLFSAIDYKVLQTFFTGNSEQLRVIESALFALALDDNDLDDSAELCKEFLHADGTNR